MEIELGVKELTSSQVIEYFGIETLEIAKCISCQNKYRAFATIGVGGFRGYAEEEVEYYSERNYDSDAILRERLMKAARADLHAQMNMHLALIQPYITLRIKE